MKENKWWIIAGVAVVAVIVAGFLYLVTELRDTKRELQESQLQYNNDLRTTVESTLKSRKDSVIIIERRIQDEKNNRRENENIVRNTHSPDSLIELYRKHRADLSF